MTYYRQHIFLCTNKRADGHAKGCCASKGAEELRAYMKEQCRGMDGVRINSAGCMDRCASGPVMAIYPEGIWYSPKNKQDVDEIIEKHIKQGARVERLLIQN